MHNHILLFLCLESFQQPDAVIWIIDDLINDGISRIYAVLTDGRDYFMRDPALERFGLWFALTKDKGVQARLADNE